MSARTSEPTTPQRTRTSARFAAASLLALAMMLPMCSTASAAEVQQLIADAQVQTETIGDDLDRVHAQLPALHPVLRNDVLDAVESVQAATDEARSALDRATDGDEAADGRAAVALADAQVALDAASARGPRARRLVQPLIARSSRATPGNASCGLTIPVMRGIPPS